MGGLGGGKVGKVEVGAGGEFDECPGAGLGIELAFKGDDVSGVEERLHGGRDDSDGECGVACVFDGEPAARRWGDSVGCGGEVGAEGRGVRGVENGDGGCASSAGEMLGGGLGELAERVVGARRTSDGLRGEYGELHGVRALRAELLEFGAHCGGELEDGGPFDERARRERVRARGA